MRPNQDRLLVLDGLEWLMPLCYLNVCVKEMAVFVRPEIPQMDRYAWFRGTVITPGSSSNIQNMCISWRLIFYLWSPRLPCIAIDFPNGMHGPNKVPPLESYIRSSGMDPIKIKPRLYTKWHASVPPVLHLPTPTIKFLTPIFQTYQISNPPHAVESSRKP